MQMQMPNPFYASAFALHNVKADIDFDVHTDAKANSNVTCKQGLKILRRCDSQQTLQWILHWF